MSETERSGFRDSGSGFPNSSSGLPNSKGLQRFQRAPSPRYRTTKLLASENLLTTLSNGLTQSAAT